jgi:hypothetical protein
MTIEEFAKKHRARVKRDEVGDVIVAAKHGQIYDYGKNLFGVMFLMDGAGAWNNRRKACEAVGMKLIQDGDTEGALLFDPENALQAKTAIRLVGARVKREMTPEQKKAVSERLAQFKFAPSSRTSEDENRP